MNLQSTLKDMQFSVHVLQNFCSIYTSSSYNYTPPIITLLLLSPWDYLKDSKLIYFSAPQRTANRAAEMQFWHHNTHSTQHSSKIKYWGKWNLQFTYLQCIIHPTPFTFHIHTWYKHRDWILMRLKFDLLKIAHLW